MTKLAHRFGALGLLGTICPAAAIAVWILAAIGFRAAHGIGSVEGGPWHELLLGVLPLAPAIVLAVGTLFPMTRPGVGAAAAAIATGVAVVTFEYFDRLAPILAGPDHASRPAAVDVARLAIGVVPLLVGLTIALRSRSAVRTQITAAAAVVSSLAALGLALPRVAQPSPSAYLSTLEPAVEIEGKRSFHLGGAEYRVEKVEPAPIAVSPNGYFTPLEKGCVLRSPHGTITLGNLMYDGDCRIGWDSRMSSHLVNVREAIYVDPRGDYAVLYQPEGTGPYMERAFARPDPRSAPRLSDGCSTYGMALRTRDGAHVTLDARVLGDRLSAPRATLIVATLGAAIAVVLMVLARRRRHLGEIAGARDALHEGGGAVRLGESVVRVEAAAALPIGPVVVAGSVADIGASPFRDGLRFERAVPGTIASTRDHAVEHASKMELAAFAIAAITAASLIGAHAAGL